MTNKFLSLNAISGSVNDAASSSYAITSSFALNAGTSTFTNTGSFTGSFTGSLLGAIISSSYANTASSATSITFVPATSSFALTAGSGGGGVGGSGTPNKISKFTAATTLGDSSISEIGNRVEVSASLDVTGSVTATSFSGAGTSVTGIISSSYATTASYASSVPFSGISALPPGLVSSSVQVNTGSFSGSFVGTIASSSYATTASFATNIATASYFSGSVLFPNGLTVTGTLITTDLVSPTATSSIGILAPNVTHAWGKVKITASSASLMQNYGISAMSKIATGSWNITWSAPFTNADYCLQLTCETIAGAFAVASTRTMYVAAGSQSVSAVAVICLDDTATTHLLKDPNSFYIAAYGS